MTPRKKATGKASTAVTKKEEKSAGFSTSFPLLGGGKLDGKEVAYNKSQYYRMYRRNTDIRRAVYEKQETAMKAGYELRRFIEYGKKEKVIFNDDFDLAMKKSGGTQALKKEIIREYEIFGEVFVKKAEKNIRGKWIKYEVLDGRYVSIITDTNLVPLVYLYQNPKQYGKVDRIPAEEIIHFGQDKDLDNPLFHTSILETIVVDVLGDQEASLSNLAYFENDSIPSALYILQDGLGATEQEQIYERIKTILSGGHNKHKNIASSHVKDVKPIRREHTDMEFLGQRKYTTERVCVAMGVPRTVLGYVEDVNHSNGESQYEKFIENTIRPIEQNVLQLIFTQILHDFVDRVEAEKVRFVVLDEHIDDFEKKSTLARENIKAGLWTINEGRDYIDYEASENEIADEILVPTTLQLLDNVAVVDPATVKPEPIPPAA